MSITLDDSSKAALPGGINITSIHRRFRKMWCYEEEVKLCRMEMLAWRS